MKARIFAVFVLVVSVAFLVLFLLGEVRFTAAQAGRPTPVVPALSASVVQAQVSKAEGPVLNPVEGPIPIPAITGPTKTAVATADAENVELVGHIGGVANAVFVQEEYAYVGEGPRLTILDISSPVSPTVVGKTAPWSDFVQDIYVSGSYAYIAANRAGLRVVDVSNPAAPTEVGLYDAPYFVNGVAVAGSYAYVADWPGGLRVVDVTNPAAPIEVGVYGTPGEGADVAVVGGYAYVVDGNGLRVVNISDPATPTEAGLYDTPGYARGVAVAPAGDYVYVADGQFGGLRVVDVSDPETPTEVGFYDTPGSAVGVEVAGSYAYVGDWTEGLRVVDVSDPADPTEVGSYDALTYAWGVAMAGDYAYVADGYDGLRVMDVSDPEAPAEVGLYDTPAYAHDVTVAGSYAYVADREGKLLWMVDVSDPAAPAEVGFYNTSGFAEGVTVVGGYAYVAETGGLRLVDVSNPAALTEVSFYPMLASSYDVTVVGGYAYVANSNIGLRIVDVSNPATPTQVGFYNTPGSANGVTVAGGYAYVADSGDGLRVVDVSDPVTPTEVGFYETPGSAYDVAVAGSYAYIADSGGGMRVVDISVPISPTEVGSYYPGVVSDVGVAGDHAYVVETNGLRVVDVSDPATPMEVGFYKMPGHPYAVAVAGGYIYIADDDSGLFILRYIEAESSPTLYPISNPDGDSDYTVDWSDVTGALTYTLQEDEDAGFTSPTVCYAGSVSQYTISDQFPGTWYYRVKVVSASGESGWSNVVSTTVNPSTKGDAYEPDDTCAQASALETDGTAQQHTFHRHEDVDWAHFTAISGTTYVLQATSTSPGADLILELYDACDGNLEGSDDNALGADARVVFTASSSGIYYARALNHDPAVYGPDVTYELSVRAQAQDSVALIVAGNNDSYQLQDNILYAANLAYRTFLNAGLPKDHIRYLSAVDDDDRTDADGDGTSDVYASSASASVEVAITTWAADLADSHTPFYLYLIDHGGVDVFLTHGSGDTITPVELDGWLNDLEDETGTLVNVIYEACHSGSFIDGLQEISEAGRVIIASTGRMNNAYPAPGRGAYFSDAFFTALGQSQDLYTSFQWGVAAVEATGLWQTPWLDDNGNAVPNEADVDDGEVARGRGLAIPLPVGGRPPVIDWVLPPASIENGEGIVRAQVRDDTDVGRVWVIVYPPSFVEPEPSPDGTMPDLGLQEVTLSDSDSDGVYIGVYEDFTEEGVYRLVVYAEDGEGNLSQPGVLEVGRWTVYLPLVLKSLGIMPVTGIGE